MLPYMSIYEVSYTMSEPIVVVEGWYIHLLTAEAYVSLPSAAPDAMEAHSDLFVRPGGKGGVS